MDAKKLIILEEGEIITKRLNLCLPQSHYTLTRISKLDEANSIISEIKPKIIIIDPYSFDSYGFKLIDIFLGQEASPVIVVMSDKRDPEVIIQLVKSGVYDYIIGDRDSYEIEHKIKKACDAAELHSLKKIHDKELRILNGYFSIHKTGGKLKHHSEDVTLINNIRRNFNQGSGIGTLVSIISLIEKHATRQDDKYLIDREIISMLLENSREVKRLIDAFENLDRYNNENQELQNITIDMVHSLVKKRIDDISPIAKKLEKKIQLNEKIYFGSQLVNWLPSYIETIIDELLLNAIKFSPKDTEIMVFLQTVEHGLLISVLNQPALNSLGGLGIPEEYHGLIFEPFFRLSRNVFDEIPTLDYGLGLTLVNLAVKKLNGSITVSNLESYIPMDKKPQKLVGLEVWLPTYNKASQSAEKRKSAGKALTSGLGKVKV